VCPLSAEGQVKAMVEVVEAGERDAKDHTGWSTHDAFEGVRVRW
jgi:hypothetical protein